jgi:hypothetical protein
MRVTLPSGVVELAPEGQNPIGIRFQSSTGSWVLFQHMRWGWGCRVVFRVDDSLAYMKDATELKAFSALCEAEHECQNLYRDHQKSQGKGYDFKAFLEFGQFLADVAAIVMNWPNVVEDDTEDYVDAFYNVMVVNV